MPMAEMDVFPALTLVRFFDNHGMLGINTHPQWRTIRGGSHSYIAPLIKPFAQRIHTGVNIQAVRRRASGVEIQLEGRPAVSFDEIVFACHGDQVLPMLGDATDGEQDVLQHFRFTPNEAILHTDDRWLPRRPAARASWNYILAQDGRVSLTYDMNRLQSLGVAENYCVSLNVDGIIAKNKLVKRIQYHHPRFDRAAVAAQSRWAEISGQSRTHYCGAYWFYGFHEDGVRSALRVAERLGVQA
jgi:predicted NAD/FAD-binding protein